MIHLKSHPVSALIWFVISTKCLPMQAADICYPSCVSDLPFKPHHALLKGISPVRQVLRKCVRNLPRELHINNAAIIDMPSLGESDALPTPTYAHLPEFLWASISKVRS